MGSRPLKGATGFALGVAIRAVLIGGLVFGALYVAVTWGFFATALVLAGVAVLVGLDLVRSASSADRILAQFIDGLIAEGEERPARGQAGFGRLSAAIDRALDRIGRSRAERQRRIDYLQTLADTVSASLFVVSPDGKVEWMNQAAHRLVGADGIAGLGPEAAGRLRALPAGAREILRLSNGTAMLASTSGFSVPGAGERKLIGLQRVAGDLDAVELKAWQDLARILSHEMMNSLTPICSLAESSQALLREPEPDTAEIGEALEVIVRRSHGLMSFVDRYRTVADLPPPQLEPVEPRALVERVDRLMGGLARSRGVGYESRLDPGGEAAVAADPELLEQAVINLLKNALDAVQDRPEARLGLTCAGDADHLVIEVWDNGPGLSPEELERAFVPFFTRKAGGSGIGLSLSRQIALAHNGRIEYRASPAGGAAFRLILPRRAAG